MISDQLTCLSFQLDRLGTYNINAKKRYIDNNLKSLEREREGEQKGERERKREGEQKGERERKREGEQKGERERKREGEWSLILLPL